MKKTRAHVFFRTAALFLLAGVLARAEEEPRAAGTPPPPKYKYPAYIPIEDIPRLPRVLLLGDSISIGYTIPARERLKGIANIHRPPENCADTSTGLRRLGTWLGAGKWDVIHFNFGLHDIKYLDKAGKYVPPAEGTQVTSPEQYEKNLRVLVRRLKSTGAALIFATTTPVPDGASGRIETDAIRYNEIAAGIMTQEGVAINDLFTFASENQVEIQLRQNVHFTERGYQLMADMVAGKIRNALAEREITAAPEWITYIGPQGDDNAAGTEAAPRRSIQRALDNAKPGDVVRLLPGVYRERVVITKGGTYGAPVTLEGMDGAVMEGHDDIAPAWSEAVDIAPGVYRTTLATEPRAVIVDGKQLVLLDESRFPRAESNGEKITWSRLFQTGFDKGGWKYVQGAGLYLRKKKEFIVRFDGNRDPRGMNIVFAPDAAVVRIEGANRCVIRNLELRHAHHGVMITNSIGSVVEGCFINRTRDGITLSRGSDRCTLRFNRITQNPLGINNGFNRAGPDGQFTDPRWSQAWDIWVAHKRYGFYDSKGINLDRSIGGHRVHDNYIHDHWDAIASRGWDEWQSTAAERMAWIHYNRGSEIHHNRIERANDEGLELNDGGIDEQWHHNFVTHTRCGLRFKPIDKGPLYAYANIFKDNAEDVRFFGGLELNPGEVYLYHNTSNSRYAIVSNKIKGIGTPEFHVYNNLFWTEAWWGNTGESVPPNWTGDNNVYFRRGKSASWEKGIALAKKQGIDRHGKWMTGETSPFVDAEAGDFRIKKEHAARRAGMDLSKLTRRALPGIGGFGETSAPDAGALPFGASMPRIPRGRDSVAMEPAGFWPEAD